MRHPGEVYTRQLEDERRRLDLRPPSKSSELRSRGVEEWDAVVPDVFARV